MAANSETPKGGNESLTQHSGKSYKKGAKRQKDTLNSPVDTFMHDLPLSSQTQNGV